MDPRKAVSREEFRRRVGTVAAAIRREGLEGLLVWSRGAGGYDQCGPVVWLTNFYNPWGAVPDSSWWSGQGYTAALITPDGRCALVTNIPPHEWDRSLVVCDQFTDEPFLHLGIATLIRERGLEHGRIGIAGRANVSLHLHELVSSAVPDARLVACDEVIEDAMRPKSTAEQTVIRETGRAADATMTAMLAASTPGATERSVARAGFTAAIEHGSLPFLVALGTGPAEDRYAPSTLPTWSTRELATGDLWHLDLGGMFGGYIFDFARTTVIGGDPTPDQGAMIDASIATVEAVISRIEPGRPIGDAVSHGLAVRREQAPYQPSPTKHDYPHLGHTIGLGFGDIWLSEDQGRPFEPGMYIAVEAVVAREGIGFAMFEQNLLVGRDTVEIVTQSPERPWRTA
jgi:Xaa-Pro dipeptidase